MGDVTVQREYPSTPITAVYDLDRICGAECFGHDVPHICTRDPEHGGNHSEFTLEGGAEVCSIWPELTR